MDDLSKELGKLLSEEEQKLRSRMRSEKEVIYETLLRSFDEIAWALGGWETENGTALDGKLWRLAECIAEGDFDG